MGLKIVSWECHEKSFFLRVIRKISKTISIFLLWIPFLNRSETFDSAMKTKGISLHLNDANFNVTDT